MTEILWIVCLFFAPSTYTNPVLVILWLALQTVLTVAVIMKWFFMYQMWAEKTDYATRRKDG